jgi:hypothetical protein
MTKANALASAKIVDFHKQYNDAKFAEIFDACHADLKRYGNRPDFVKFLTTVQEKLGKHKSSENVGGGAVAAASASSFL